jgi:methylmalonyl-CoA mutase N-terminal domain/subunit
MQALAAVLGGTQSLHTNSLDETYALPTEEAVTIALRTQQIVAEESGVAALIDPLAGSYHVEWMTNELERRAIEYIERIDAMGGMLGAIDRGYPQREIARASYEFEQALNRNERIVVGVNGYAQGEDAATIPTLRVDPELQRQQIASLAQLKAGRDAAAVAASLARVRAAAKGSENLMPPIIAAAHVYATEQEICDVLREVFGTYTDPAEF